MEQIENEGSGITLGYIFRMIFSQKWIALVIAAVITVAGTLGLYFLGKKGETYSVSFVLQLPTTGEVSSTSYTYPDGERFYFTDIISYENLKDVADNEDYSEIDVDAMVKRNDISIMRTVDKLIEDSKEGVGVYELSYTVKVKASYFSDEDVARGFIDALIAAPREYVGKMNINYDQSLTTSKSAVTYEEQLTLLKNQTVYIQAKYNELIKNYGEEFVVKDGRTLAQCKDEVDAYLTKDLFTSLANSAKKNGYIKDGDGEYLKYVSELYSKEQQRRAAQLTVDGLSNVTLGQGSIVYDRITELNREIANLTLEIEILHGYIDAFENEKSDKIKPADFESELTKVEATVSKFTEDIKPVASYVYGRVTKTNYLSTKVVEVEGGRSLTMSLLISLVAGIVVAAAVAFVVGWSKDRKKTVNVKVTDIPVYGEAQLQAAATDTTESEEDTKKDK